MNNRNVLLVIVIILGSIAALGCSESNDNTETTNESEIVQTGETQATQEEIPAQANTEEAETIKQTPLSNDTEESEITTETIPEETPALATTSTSETTLQLSESKKEELIGYMTKYYGADEVSILFIAPLDSSSNGLVMVDYYTDAMPTQTTLNNNMANIIILSRSLAKESGITTNPTVSVCAMTMDGTPLGIGNYYPSTDKTYIDVSDCPW